MAMPVSFWRAKVVAQKTVTFTAAINPGLLLTDIRDQLGRSILDPVVNLGRLSHSTDCRANSESLFGELGEDSQRVYVDNPGAAYGGWTLTLSPIESDDAVWRGQDGSQFDYNDAGQGGCIDTDDDGVAGLLSIDPSGAVINTDCLYCSTTDILRGTANESSFGEDQSITLLRANDNSDELGRWYMTGIKLRQTVPAGQEGDNYELDLVLTATAT